MRGVLKGARCDLERQEAEPPLSFFNWVNYVIATYALLLIILT